MRATLVLFAPFAFASLRRVAALALVFSMAAEIERDLISKRTIEGVDSENGI
jgi:hypothetical protein